MAYDDTGEMGEDLPVDTGAAPAPETETETESEGGSFYLPDDFPMPEGAKPGDTITLRVVVVSEDGEIEVAPVETQPTANRPVGGDDLRDAMMEGES